MQPMAIKQLLPTTPSALIAPQPVAIAKSARNFAWGWLETGREDHQEREELRNMHHEVMRFCSDIMQGLPPRWLLLCGRSGVGKTHLATRAAECIGKYAEWCYNKHGRPAIDPKAERYDTAFPYAQCGPIFTKWARIIDSARDGDYEPYKFASKDYFKVVDDVGAEGFGQDKRPTAFVINQLGKLADDRMRKWTLWTSNFGLGDFAELFDTRIASRMLRDGNAVVEVTARDYNTRASV